MGPNDSTARTTVVAEESSAEPLFSPRDLLIPLGIGAVLGILLLVQDGGAGLWLAGKLAGGGKAKPGSASKSGPAPPLFVRAPEPLQTVAPQVFERRSEQARRAGWRVARATHSLARMDETAAAQILTKLTDDQAVALLAGLDEFALGRILESAPPDRGAQWLVLLTERRELPPGPAALTPPGPEAGSPAEGSITNDALGAGPEASPPEASIDLPEPPFASSTPT